MLIGLMGKSGTGKTTISMLFKELNSNIQIINIDKIGHQSHDDKLVRKKLLEYFGKRIFNEDSTVNRKILSNIVFNDSEMMKKLYDATYEFMIKRIDSLIPNSEITILDYALLPNTKYFDLCDLKILVVTPFDERCKRVILRDNISISKYIKRDANSIDYSKFTFDYVIENDGDINILKRKVCEIYDKSIVSW